MKNFDKDRAAEAEARDGLMDRAVKVLASGFGLGYVPVAPWTAWAVLGVGISVALALTGVCTVTYVVAYPNVPRSWTGRRTARR